MKRLFLAAFVLLSLAAPHAHAAEAALPQVDLILPPALVTPDAPFYRGAKIKVDKQIVPITEGALPAGQVAEYHPDTNEVVVSDSDTISETAKGQALLDVVSAMQVGEIATAAGTEKPVDKTEKKN